MRNIRPLDALIPKTRQGILSALLMRPDKAWYSSEIAKWMHVPPSSLQRELSDMTNAGILTTYRQGRMVYYQANPESPIFSDLKNLFIKTAGLVDIIGDNLYPLKEEILIAFIYGSIATNTERNDSDVDLMLIGTVSPMELALPLRRAGEMLGRDINPTVYKPTEFIARKKARDHFLTRVLEKPKLFVIGGANELGKITR